MSPVGLNELLAILPPQSDPNLLVGYETKDDAGIYQISPDIALIITVDIITPPVDDPYIFGQIAACNALSDIYAMGGRPLTCLNIMGFPENLGLDVLKEILAGGSQIIQEAGAVLVGGHTIRDDEPKYGLSVVGTVSPTKYWSNKGAKTGDVLILTKPLGSGVLFSASKKNLVSSTYLDACIKHVTTLNKKAADAIATLEVHSVTDVTGFGLLGHMLEMAQASNVTFEIESSTIPIFDAALELSERGLQTSITLSNLQSILPHLSSRTALNNSFLKVLADPQTNGGLLIAVPEKESKKTIEALYVVGATEARIIGKVQSLESSYIKVL